MWRAISALEPARPTFVSVTYGAGGSTRDKTVELVCRIKHELGIETMAHLTCVGADRHEIHTVLQRLRAAGIDNVLALRGDPPRDQPHFVQPANGFAHADELVRFIRANGFPFSIGAACYPEGHVECRDRDTDLGHLVTKLEAGVDFAILGPREQCQHIAIGNKGIVHVTSFSAWQPQRVVAMNGVVAYPMIELIEARESFIEISGEAAK